MRRCKECGQLVVTQGVVLIAESELRGLLEAASSGIRGDDQHRHKSRSPIDNDQELADFIRSRAAAMTVKEIRTACLEHFGGRRTPSRSAIYRYLDRILPKPAATR